MSGPGFIQEEKPQQCDLCGIIAELRPYGPNDECICHSCGLKNPVTTYQKLAAYLIGITFSEDEARRHAKEIGML